MNPDIAVIDSGVNPMHPHVQKLAGGHGYGINENGQPEIEENFLDEIGHGTAIAGIIRHKAPFADLYALKIFKKELNAPACLLIEALKWSIDRGFKIIHLSLGVTDDKFVTDLDALCRRAAEKNIIILASAKGPEDRTCPAFFETVIGVCRHGDCGWDQMVFHPDARIQFGAHGRPRPIPGLPQEQNFQGHSFAVAHVTARVARLVKNHPEKDVSWITDQLANQANFH